MLLINNQAHLTEDETMIFQALLENFVTLTNDELRKGVRIIDKDHKYLFDKAVELINVFEGVSE